jgi:hypothetical protein
MENLRQIKFKILIEPIQNGADRVPESERGMDSKRNHTGFMETPEPTMPPITSMVASDTPSKRRGLEVAKPVGSVLSAQATFSEISRSVLLPTRFARLAGMALVVIASTAATAGTSTAAGTAAAAAGSAGTAIGLGAGFIDIQCPAAQLFPVQRRNGLLGFRGIGHFYECKAPGTAGVTVGDQADLIDFAMRFE